MANTKMKDKMKKVMLVAGMATAMNIGMAINNGGYSMMKEEDESEEISLKKHVSVILEKVSDGTLSIENLDVLKNMNDNHAGHSYIQSFQEFTLNHLIDEGLKSCNSKIGKNKKINYEKIKNTLTIIKGYDVNSLSEGHQKFLRFIVESICYRLAR